MNDSEELEYGELLRAQVPWAYDAPGPHGIYQLLGESLRFQLHLRNSPVLFLLIEANFSLRVHPHAEVDPLVSAPP